MLLISPKCPQTILPYEATDVASDMTNFKIKIDIKININIYIKISININLGDEFFGLKFAMLDAHIMVDGIAQIFWVVNNIIEILE